MKRAFWIWNIQNCEGGDPLAIAAAANQAGLSDVFVKVADGVVKFGIDKARNYDRVPAVVQALRGVGIRVWGWQYVYGQQPEYEEKVATQRIQELKLDGFIVDAEAEFKKPGFGKKAETYLSRLKVNNPGVTIAFSSFRFPQYHLEFPWQVFLKYCDLNMPQVYWLQAHNAGAQMQLCYDRFWAMTKMPMWPAGPAWKENGWRPSLSEIREFEKVAAENGIEQVSYWSWEHCRRDLPELWPQAEKPKDPEVPQPVDNRLAEIEKRIAALKVPISELKTAVSKLETLVSEIK